MKTPALLLAGALSLASLAQAGPRPKAPPTQPHGLSRIEQTCEGYGQYTLAVGLNRNAGVSMFTVLRRARAFAATHKVHPELQALYEEIITMVYARPAVSPVGLQQTMEVECLELLRQATPTPVPTKDRY